MSVKQLVLIELVHRQAPQTTNIHDKSWLLCAISQFEDKKILTFLSVENRREDLGKLFHKLEPTEQGSFRLELGLILPNWLPDLNGHQDYQLSVQVDDTKSMQIAFSNQMSRVRYRRDETFVHTLVPYYLSEKLWEAEGLKIPDDSHIERLKTMAVSQFEIYGDDAERALEQNVDSCIDEFINAINRVISAHLMMPKARKLVIAPSLDRSSFDYVYVLLRGKDPNRLEGARIGLNLIKATLQQENYSKEEVQTFLDFVEGKSKVRDTIRLLHSGKSYIEAGLLEFALLQLVISAEIATTRFVHTMWQASGVSSTKIKENAKQFTYSQMLNVSLFALCPPGNKPDRQLVGSIDRGRQLRNDVMHEGIFSATREELRKLHDDTVKYIEFLESIIESRKLIS